MQKSDRASQPRRKLVIDSDDDTVSPVGEAQPQSGRSVHRPVSPTHDTKEPSTINKATEKKIVGGKTSIIKEKARLKSATKKTVKKTKALKRLNKVGKSNLVQVDIAGSNVVSSEDESGGQSSARSLSPCSSATIEGVDWGSTPGNEVSTPVSRIPVQSGHKQSPPGQAVATPTTASLLSSARQQKAYATLRGEVSLIISTGM